MWIGRQRQANAVLTLCGFLLAETPVCLRRSDFENPEAARGGVVERSWGWSAGGPGGAAAGGRALFLASRSCADRGLFPLRLQESCGEAMVAPTPPGTRRRGTRRYGAGILFPIPTRARRLDRDRATLPGQNVPPTQRSSTANRLVCAWAHHGALFSSVCVSCPSWEQH